MPGWDLAYDAQTDLIRFNQTDRGLRYLAEMARSMGHDHDTWNLNTGEYELDEDAKSQDARTRDLSSMVGASAGMLQQAEPIYVFEDIVDIINYASPLFDFEPLVESDLLTNHGFVYFDKAIDTIDSKGAERKIRAMQFNLIGFDIVKSDSDSGEFRSGSRDEAQQMGLIITEYADWRDDPPEARMRPVAGSNLTMMHIMAIPFGEKRLGNERGTASFLKPLKVFFRLAQQEIAVRHQERAQRPVWKRASNWRQIKEVTVFRLRRAKATRYEGEGEEVQWSHRWLVQGHWRNQWYPSEKLHRQIWIAPYNKGPDGKPIVFKRRAFEFVR